MSLVGPSAGLGDKLNHTVLYDDFDMRSARAGDCDYQISEYTSHDRNDRVDHQSNSKNHRGTVPAVIRNYRKRDHGGPEV